ncbi:MAG: hypothetical protein JWQ14_1670 [Adhaeribacter sp.]|jgi:hypothetical protein|nr:hypothetical protein [Adhaeribacter sp.]
METQEPQLLKDYSENEKAAYLGAIASVASADRVASPEEIQFLTLLSQSAGLTEAAQQEVLGQLRIPLISAPPVPGCT